MARIPAETFKLKDGREVQIRSLDDIDVDAFLDLRETISHETTHTLQIPGRAPDREVLQKRWRDQQTHPVNVRLGAFDGSLLVAVLMFFQEEDHPWVKHVAKFGMYSCRSHWGQGIGTKLLAMIEVHARICGVSRIEANVRVENVEGLALYKKAGYQIEGTRKAAALIEGRFRDEYFIAKNLTDVMSSIQGAATDRPSPPAWLPPSLETEHLILRALTENDAGAMFEYTGDPEVSLYTLWSPHKSIEDTLAFIRSYAFENYSKKECEPFGICLKDNPARVIGTCGGWWKSETSRKMEIGYALSRPYWGKGIMTEAVTAVIAHLFNAYPMLERVEAHHKKENVGSGKVMQKCGMIHEGTIRSGIFSKGRFWDMELYSVLRSEWNRLVK